MDMDQEQSVLRWGGLAGMLGSVLLVAVFVFVGDAATAEVWVERFPELRAARTIENSLFLVVLILWVPHFLALYRALRGASLAPPHFGNVLGILGLVVLVAEALPHVAQAPISDLYHAPRTTQAEQVTLAFLWQATQGILDAMLVTRLVVLLIAVVCLGVAMLRAPAFGTAFGGLSVVLGALGVGAATLLLVNPDSVPGALVGVFALIAFHVVLGWKVNRLSRSIQTNGRSAYNVAGSAS
jgi:hypothetical protein